MTLVKEPVKLYGALSLLIFAWQLFSKLNHKVATHRLSEIFIPTGNTWGNIVIDSCDKNEGHECLYHSFIHEHAPGCVGTFLDCAQLVHAVSDVGAMGPFYRTNNTCCQLDTQALQYAK